MVGLEEIVQRLLAEQVQGEMWVNGSFLTQKIDPLDSDVVLRIPNSFLDSASPDQIAVVEWVATDDLKSSHHCDSYVFVAYPDEHPKYWEGEYAYAYWMRQWGFDRSDNLKGMAVLSLFGSP